MKKRQCCAGALSAASALALLAGASVSAQTTVEVNADQTLTEDELLAGMFDGQTFTLSPELRFEINFGGAIGPVGDGGSLRPFDFAGSTVNINDGGFFPSSAERPFLQSLVSNVILNVFTGGGLGNVFNAFDGSVVKIAGGDVGRNFRARSGSVVNITGGAVGQGFSAHSGSVVKIAGGEFQLNGAAVSDLSGGLPAAAVLTGTLADGSVFIFASGAGGDTFASGTTTLNAIALPPADSTPTVVSTGQGPKGLRPGQTLTLTGDASLRDNFAAVSGTLNIEGGSVGAGLETAFSQVNITGGTVGHFFRVYSGSDVNIAGGSVGQFFDARSGSVVNITGGSVGERFGARSGSVVNITGGAVGEHFGARSGSVVNISGGSVGLDFAAFDGSVVNISGGSVGESFLASSGSEVNLFVTELLLNGNVVDLALGESVLITQRGGALLEATLADGSFLDFTLNDLFVSGADLINFNASLTVTRVPTPGALALLSLAGAMALRSRRRGG